MKKLLMLMAIAAMASGAWALDTQYSFDLEIRGIPYSYTHLTAEATLYLVDTSANNLILAYGKAGEWDGVNSHRDGASPSTKIISTTGSSGIEHSEQGTVTINGQVYRFASGSHTMRDGSTVTDKFFDVGGNQLAIDKDSSSQNYGGPINPTVAATKNVEFNISAITSSSDIEASIASAISKGQWNNDLIAVLYDAQGGYYQVFGNVEYVNNAGTPRFQANGSFVPEPTSGFLVLLGVAGLALRRRKAA